MIHIVPVREKMRLEDYEGFAHLTGAVRDLRAAAADLAPRLRNRTVTMVNSTSQGGGVAEMLPKMISLLNDLGVRSRWAVIRSDRPEFFTITKRIHNMIHGQDDAVLDREDRRIYEEINRRNADALKAHLAPEDILVVHDPQPLPLGALLKKELGVRLVWRCHIGLDKKPPPARSAWKFLRPYADHVDHAVFSAPEYVPAYFSGRSRIIHPAIDPCSHKNRELSPHKMVGILCNAGLQRERHPVLTPPFSQTARRLTADGSFVPAEQTRELGLLYRPIVTQVSRWDRLKGFLPLLEAFVRLKERPKNRKRQWVPRHRHCLEIVRLVLAGPDPASIEDDPEGLEVLDSLREAYRALSTRHQNDISILALPLGSRKENALMVNALQQCSTIVVQNSIQEGFGLTATEAMWKRVPVLGTHACGLRHQIRDGIDGVLTRDPGNSGEIADHLDRLLEEAVYRHALGRSAQRRVYEEFLVFSQLRRWLELLALSADAPPALPRPS